MTRRADQGPGDHSVNAAEDGVAVANEGTRRTDRRRALAAIIVIAIVALIGAAAVVAVLKAGRAGQSGSAQNRVNAPPVPRVEPVAYLPVPAEQARVENAAIPLSPLPLVPARAFGFPGGAEDRMRARDCLAAALWYEAGDDARGQADVAQVILNRVRHPAFPHSVCGVVFQGSERSTGCQFTFACDGSIDRRRPSATAWARATAVAASALSGRVDKAVGLATHYHADYVMPNWNTTLDKVAVIGPHLFYRWRGFWGTRAAFVSRAAAVEPAIAHLAALSSAHASAAAMLDPLAPGTAGTPAVAATLPDAEAVANAAAVATYAGRDLKGHQLTVADPAQGRFILKLAATATTASHIAAARELCRGLSDCTVMGWRAGGAVPRSFADTSLIRDSMTFLYRHGPSTPEFYQWNCAQITDQPPAQCIGGLRTP